MPLWSQEQNPKQNTWFTGGEMRFLKLIAYLFVCICVLYSLPLSALDDDMQAHHHEAGEQLGKVSFPISCAPASQKPFERGVALLHSFGYEAAAAQFEDIVKKEPTCAMAHWGVAMSLFHQIWERPPEASLKQGLEEIEKAQKIGAKTDRERGYISALALFYRDPAANDHLKRAAAYSDEMGKLYQKYPEDLEAGAFYALSLLAAEPPDDTSLSSEKKAVEVLNVLFQKNPEHPGLAHYIIHACDSPQMAPMGLGAARRYAEIASSSSHAVHMPSHIFARLGLWQEDIRANLKSVALVQSSGEAYMHGHELHAMHFLLYAYLQTGQDEAAKKILDESKQIVASAIGSDDTGMMEYIGYAAAHFPALYDLEMHRWSDAAALQPRAGASPHLQMITYWARTIATARLGDANATRSNAQKYDELREATRKTKYAYVLEGPNFGGREVQAWLTLAEKKNGEALRQIRELADIQDKVGKAEVDIPGREMLADMLLELNQPQEALAEYEKSMKIDPNRFNVLAGAARAAELAHQPEKANSYHAQLLKNCDNGKNSDRPELSRAKVGLARNP
jgi:tetratricopeptide (TPR) repeat protein